MSISNQPDFSFHGSSHSNSRSRNYSNNQSRNSSNKRNRNYSNDRSRNYSNDRNPRYQNNPSRDYSNNRSNFHRSKYNNYQNRSRDNSRNINSSYNNRQRNYSQSPHRNITRYQNSQQKYRSSTPKHQRQINQVQSTEDTHTQPDPPGIDNNERTELQLNHINCESTDSESDTENTISSNMIHVEHVYEPFVYQQPIYSHIYQNHDQLLLNYYTRPLIKNDTKEKIVKIVDEITEKKPTECLSTNNIYQNIPEEKQSPKQKIWTTPLLLESPKCKQFQTPDLETEFLIDTEAESNIINIPTLNGIKILHPKLFPSKQQAD